MFRKPETEQMLEETTKLFKPINTYLENQRKVSEALTTLDDKILKSEDTHKDYIQTMGMIEAKRLLGQATDKEEKSLNVSLTDIRDEKDRLQSAKVTLEKQSEIMQQQAPEQSDTAGQILTPLARSIESELEEELREAAARITSVVNRLHALYEGMDFSKSKTDIFKMQIPSIINGENLFQPPTRYHSSLGEEYTQPWKSDAEALKLYQRLHVLGLSYKQIKRLERQAERAESRAAA